MENRKASVAGSKNVWRGLVHKILKGFILGGDTAPLKFIEDRCSRKLALAAVRRAGWTRERQ